MKKPFFLILLALIAAALAFAFVQYERVNAPAPAAEAPVVTTFEACAAAYPVMESMPRQCRTPDGRLFAEELPATAVYENATADDIEIELPFPGAVTGKEFAVTGRARGPWFFEASFPVEVRDQNNALIAQGVAEAQGEWMTTDFVPFRATITAPQSFIGPATLILKKQNASGDPERDASLSVPITIEY